jgi:N-acetylmuramic acid 6-phosphate etherase
MMCAEAVLSVNYCHAPTEPDHRRFTVPADERMMNSLDGDDPLAPLRDELGNLTTEAVGPYMDDLDLRPTRDLVQAMNAQDAIVPKQVAVAAPEIAEAVDRIAARMRRGGRLIYVGAGTSGRLGVLDASECPPTFGVEPGLVVGVLAGGDSALRGAVEAAEDATGNGRRAMAELDLGPYDTVVGIAASGRTPFVIGALQQAFDCGCLTIALACNADSAIGKIADIKIEVVVGPELIAGSTRLKSGTAQKLVLNMLSTLTMVRLGKTYGNIMIDLQATNEKLHARAQRTVMAVTGCGPAEAADALSEAKGSAKVATLMLLAGVNASEAKRRLDASSGVLRAALQDGGAPG